MILREKETGRMAKFKMLRWTGSGYTDWTADYLEFSDEEMEVEDLEYVKNQALDCINCVGDFSGGEKDFDLAVNWDDELIEPENPELTYYVYEDAHTDGAEGETTFFKDEKEALWYGDDYMYRRTEREKRGTWYAYIYKIKISERDYKAWEDGDLCTLEDFQTEVVKKYI